MCSGCAWTYGGNSQGTHGFTSINHVLVRLAFPKLCSKAVAVNSVRPCLGLRVMLGG